MGMLLIQSIVLSDAKRWVPYMTGILYAIDAKISVLIKITVENGTTSAVSSGPDVVLEADVTEGMVRIEIDARIKRVPSRSPRACFSCHDSTANFIP